MTLIDLSPQALQARLLHRDGLVLIIDKPAGIAVHAGPGRGDNLERHFEALRFGLPRNPALAHRLDKDTSGCLVLGRHPKALAKLGKLFASGRAEKTYWAVVLDGPREDAGTIDAPLARRSAEARSWWMKVDPQGDPSLTHFRVLGRGDGISWLELTPETGRTHQLRVHCAHIGCPIVGDRIYGGDRALAAADHLHLHARAISLPLAAKGPPVSAVAPAPAHMLKLLAACGFAGETATAAIHDECSSNASAR